MKRTISEVIELIKQKKESAKQESNKLYASLMDDNTIPKDNSPDYIVSKYNSMVGNIDAYTDILALLESSHLVEQEKEYKDIEKDIKLPLNILFKALKNEGIDNTGIYALYPETKELCYIPLPELYYCCHQWNIGCRSTKYNGDSWDCKPSDYKKTWWLKEDKSE